jgi:hypothetical protein
MTRPFVFADSSGSEVEHAQHNQDQFRFHRAAVYSQHKSKVGNILTKATSLRINLNIDDAPIDSHTHTHPSHSQTSHLLFTFLSLGTPFPRLALAFAHAQLIGVVATLSWLLTPLQSI